MNQRARHPRDRVRTGLDRLIESGVELPGKARIALLANGTTVSAGWVPSAEAVARVPGVHLDRLLSPQHGFAAEKQDNMVESGHGSHSVLGIPIWSLYAERREPTPEMLDGIDILAIDLQDVGTRVYTFLVTALMALGAALGRGIPVVILDRPNPIGGAMEGPILEPAYASFVGIVDVPLRHGLTAAEYCLYGAWRLGAIDEAAARRVTSTARAMPHAAGAISIAEPLTVVPMSGWRRTSYFDEAALPWTMPSPNMPDVTTAVVYPGQVLLEGTNLSEGRGTTRPFEIFGAPYLDLRALKAVLTDEDLAGVVLREVAFEPTFQKHAGRLCRGFQIHVLERVRFEPVRLTTALIAAARLSADFDWRREPYEYEHERLAIDLLYGTDRIRRAIESGARTADIAASWAADVDAFGERVAPLLIYDD